MTRPFVPVLAEQLARAVAAVVHMTHRNPNTGDPAGGILGRLLCGLANTPTPALPLRSA